MLRAHKAGEGAVMESEGREKEARRRHSEKNYKQYACAVVQVTQICLRSSDGGSQSVILSAWRRLCAVGVRAISGSYFRLCLKKKVQCTKL